MTVLYLDPYFLGDPLFLGGFARDLAARPSAPLVVVHGSGDAGERALEAQGLVARETDGVWDAPTAPARAAVERATRELNRAVVHELNEANVAAVRVMGLDRGLLKLGAGGAPTAGRAGWLTALADQGAVPVVAALGQGESGVVELDAARGAAEIARGVGADAVTMLLRGRAPAVQSADGAVAELAAADLPGVRGLPSPQAALRVVQAGVAVRLTSLSGIRAADSTQGTRVLA